jgi:hypothetical protein
MFSMPRLLQFDSTNTTLNRGNTNLNKEGDPFSDTGDNLLKRCMEVIDYSLKGFIYLILNYSCIRKEKLYIIIEKISSIVRRSR